MATVTERERFRRKLNGDVNAMPDAYVDAIFTEMRERYAGKSDALILAAAVYEGALHLRQAAAKRATYQQGESREQLSDVPGNLDALIVAYREDLHTLLRQESAPSVSWRDLKRPD